jgi:hypothetical protein
MQEAMLILASLTRRYRFEPGPGADPEPTSRLTIRSLDGISLRVWKRPQADLSQMTEDHKAVGTAEVPKCPFH